MTFPKGSEWRQWDLHVHTPASFFWEGGKKLAEMTPSEKEVAIKKFIEVVNTSEVSVFAIQDYWTFDWMLELKKYLHSHSSELTKTVLPGMELRVESPTEYRLNIHVILSDKLTTQQLSDFKSELKLRVGAETKKLSNDALIECARSLDVSKAKAHSYGDPSTLDDKQLLELGSKTAIITRESLTTAFEQIPKGSGFILLPYDTSDGLLNLDWSKHPHDDNYFMQTAHLFESRDQRNIDLFNGIETDKNRTYFANFFKTLGNTAKPCVAGSDAHKFTNYGKYPSNKATWIKSDPTFEGLKQIMYECSDRVKIQELKPEEKSTYTLIDRVEYTSSDGFAEVVYFNQNLNAIIGSRAQGKSNLLKNIAYSIDPSQCKLRNVELKDFFPLTDLKVIWTDGTFNSLNASETKEKSILFIPQKYLGELVYETDPRFDNFLTNLFENRDDFRTAIESYKKFEGLNILLLTSLIREVLAARSTGFEKRELLKKIGKKEDFDKDIKEIEEKIKKCGKTSSITPVEIKEHELINTEKLQKEKTAKVILQDIKAYEDLKKDEVINSDRVFELAFSPQTLEKIEEKLSASNEAFKVEFVDEEILSLKKMGIQIDKDIKALEKLLKPLQDKLNESKTLLELTKLLEKSKNSRKQIEDIEKELVAIRASYNLKKKELIDVYFKYETEYNNLKIDLGELNFSQIKLIVSFDIEQFKKVIDDNINYHNSTVFRKDEDKIYVNANIFLNDPASAIYTKATFSILIKELLGGILSGNLLLKSGKDITSVLLDLFKNRYKIDFLESIKSKKGIKFSEMSDGEQMIALLEFIFKFDDFNYPVFLDQPEDDLDSRAISTTIVDFIKTEKTKRQIIVVSHNANLVVCSDSEEILVSSKKGKFKPDFKYISGAIEDKYINKEIVEILEGGDLALQKRMKKLNIS